MYLISIIIPVYNAEDTIERTLQSLNNLSIASKKQCEVVIVDDGSQDNSMEVVKSIKTELSAFKLVIVQQENRGLSAARNAGLNHCNGEWIFFLDSDDEMAFDPIPLIEQSRDSSALGFSIKYYKDLKKKGARRPVLITPENHLDIFTAENAFTVSSIIFKKESISSMFDVNFRSYEDLLFWIKNPLIFKKMKVFPDEYSAIIHSHGRNLSSDYVTMGSYRKKVADRVLAEFADRLTLKQKNNLFIQSQIGLVLQRKKRRINTFFRFPCDMKLYAKLIIYFLFWKNFSKYDIYGR